MITALNEYITKAREKNLSAEQIKNQLSEMGWPQERIAEAFAYTSDLPIPPAPLGKGPIIWWLGLCYFLFFVSLSALAIGIAGILHNWVDNSHLVPLGTSLDASASSYDFIATYFGLSSVQLIQIYLPTIIISYVISVLLAIFLKRQEIQHPTVKELKFYKIILFALLAGTLLITMIEGITAGYAYLSGDLASITFRHLLVVLLSSCVIFVYFFSEIDHFGEIKKDLFAFIYITIFTVLALLYGFSLIPSVVTERQITYDHKRIINLANIQLAIDNDYATKGSLPKSLNEVSSDSSISTTPLVKVDPQTQQPYEYIITDPTDYKLCANFSIDSSKDDPNGYDNANFDYSSYKQQFTHHVGHQCFDETENDNTVDNSSTTPDMYCTGDGCPQSSPIPTINPTDMTPTPVPFKTGVPSEGL